MKKIIILLYIIISWFFIINENVFSNFEPWETFNHWYTISNSFSCNIKITKVKKCYSVENQSSEWTNIFTNVYLRWSSIVRNTNSNCYEYNPSYTINGNSASSWWDITYFTRNNLVSEKVNSSFEFDFEILWNCTDDWSITNASVNSSIIWITPVPAPVPAPGWGWWNWGWWNWGWWGWGWWGSNWNSSYCWDHIVQRPNESLTLEECDFWNTSDFPDWCGLPTNSTNACKILNSTILNATIFKAGPEILFNNKLIIWAWANPFEQYSKRPYIKNNWDSDLFFDKICVIDSEWSTLLWQSTCKKLWLILKWKTKYFPEYPDFTWVRIWEWFNYGDNKLITTIKHNNIIYPTGYFASEINIRVVKASIWTLGWWTTYLKDSWNIWDISKVKQNNKNFIWTSISNISSYSNNITNNDSISSIKVEWNRESAINTSIDTSIDNTLNIDDFKKYNWNDNIFILKNKNFIINTDLNIDWTRTYIIENWNLIINKDITSNNNIAFIVKWWNFIINKDVQNITWVYISIGSWLTSWKFIATWWTTKNILKIKWTLYWNIDNLVQNRVYIKNNSSWQIDVWTIVSFGSNLFKKPAPLIWKFIWEYLKSKKIAQ